MAKLKLDTATIIDIVRDVESLLLTKGVTMAQMPELVFRADKDTINKINENIYYATHPKSKEDVEPCDEIQLKAGNLLTFKLVQKEEANVVSAEA